MECVEGWLRWWADSRRWLLAHGILDTTIMRLRITEVSDFLLRCAHVVGRVNYWEKTDAKKESGAQRHEDLRQVQDTGRRVTTRTNGADLGFILKLAGA